MLERNEYLEKLVITNLRLEPDRRADFRRRLPTLMPRITSLTMRECHFLDYYLLHAIYSSALSLEELELQGCPIRGMVIEGLRNLKSLTLTNMPQCDFFTVLSDTVERLDLSQGTLYRAWKPGPTPGLVMQSSNPIMHPETLTDVDVSRNTVPTRDDGFPGLYHAGDPMGEFLRSLTDVRHLSIAHVRWHEEIAILDLASLAHLQTLNVSGLRGVQRVVLPHHGVAVVESGSSSCMTPWRQAILGSCRQHTDYCRYLYSFTPCTRLNAGLPALDAATRSGHQGFLADANVPD